MARFTKALRQRLIREFAELNDGHFCPAAFVEHVKATGPDHEAHSWFTWDDEKAAHEHRLSEARQFASGLRVSFTVETARRGVVVSSDRQLPFAMSPVEGRRDGGGYVIVNPDDPEHMAEHCRQAAASLATWLNRYSGAVEHVGGSVAQLERLKRSLDKVAVDRADDQEAA